MIKAVVQVAQTRTEVMEYTSYLIFEYDAGPQQVSVTVVKEAIIEVEDTAQQLVARQKSNVVTSPKGFSCSGFLDMLGDYNHEGKLKDVREID